MERAPVRLWLTLHTGYPRKDDATRKTVFYLLSAALLTGRAHTTGLPDRYCADQPGDGP